jgi:peptide/nickel transport system substrate-binding protein
MSEQSFPKQQPFRGMWMSRRKMMQGVGIAVAAAALAPATLHVTGQQSSTPAASPVTTPFPPAVPETSLNIVRDQRPEYAGTPQKGTDLRMYVRTANLDNFSPTAQLQDVQIPVSLYDPLVWIDEVTMEPEPWLAESWSWSDDGLILTFQIRDDVVFHDGSPLTAEDVRFSFVAYRDDYESAMASFFALVVDVAVEGASTVHVTFSETDGAFLYNAASQPIFSSAQYTAHWEGKPIGERSLSGYPWADNAPLGTGPWMLTGVRDGSLMFGRNDAYWQGPPHFEQLQLIAEDDQQTRLEGWKNGDVDIVSPVRATDMWGLWSEEGSLYVAEAPVSFFAAFNFANPANATPDMMRDPALRGALTLAVDRARYARDVFHGFIDEDKAGTVTQPWAHDDSVTNPVQDIDEANRMLDAAGWVDFDGDGVREHPSGNRLDLYCIVNNRERSELLELLEGLKQDFSAIGARLTVQQIEPDEFDSRWVENRMYDMVAYSLVQYPAFAEFDLYGTAWDIRINPRGWNPGGYSNATVDEAINEYFAAWTQDDMRAALGKLQVAANDDRFGLWFGFPHDLVLVKPDIQGFTPHKYFQTWNTRALWRGESVEATPEPIASPAATPVVEPAATPVSATPVASPVT